MTKVNSNEKIDIDKDKIIEDIVADVKEELRNEIDDILDSEIKSKLSLMEKNVHKYKRVAIIKKNILIFILLIVVILETKLLYDNNVLSKYLSNSDEVEVNDNFNSVNSDSGSDEKTVDDYIKEYGYLLNLVNTTLNGDDFTYLYKKDYEKSSIDNKIKLNMAYSILDSSKIGIADGVIRISEDDIYTSYKKIFGTEEDYTIDNFDAGCNNFIYNKSNESYMAIDLECTSSEKEISKEITNVYIEGDNVIIEAVVAIIDDKNLTTINGEVIDEYSSDKKISDYSSKLDKYRYTFTKEGNSYYFSMIEKV